MTVVALLGALALTFVIGSRLGTDRWQCRRHNEIDERCTLARRHGGDHQWPARVAFDFGALRGILTTNHERMTEVGRRLQAAGPTFASMARAMTIGFEAALRAQEQRARALALHQQNILALLAEADRTIRLVSYDRREREVGHVVASRIERGEMHLEGTITDPALLAMLQHSNDELQIDEDGHVFGYIGSHEPPTSDLMSLLMDAHRVEALADHELREWDEFLASIKQRKR